jgi:hypothetical protein
MNCNDDIPLARLVESICTNTITANNVHASNDFIDILCDDIRSMAFWSSPAVDKAIYKILKSICAHQ